MTKHKKTYSTLIYRHAYLKGSLFAPPEYKSLKDILNFFLKTIVFL